MNMDTARLTINACIEDALDAPKAERLAKDETWFDEQISKLLQAATAANPDGRNMEAEHQAVRDFADQLTVQLRS